MKYISLILALTLMMARPATADVAITGLPAVVAANVGANDVFPFVQLSTGRTSKFKIAQILSIPALQSPTFTGTLTSALIVAGAGAVGAPSITVGDTTTGWYRGAANDIRMAVSGILTTRVTTATVWMPVYMYMNVLGTSAVENLIATNVNDNTLRLTGDVASGFGGEVKLGSRNASIGQVVEFYNAAVKTGSISAAGLWTIGASGSTVTHALNGNMAHTYAVANTASTLTVIHSDNTSDGSRAIIRAQGGGTSGGDPVVSWYVNGSTEFMAGIDVSDSRKWKLAGSGALGTSDFITVTTGGLVTLKAVQAHRIFGSLNLGDGTTGDLLRPDGLGNAFEVGNGDNYSFGNFNVRNAAGSATRFNVTDAGIVNIGTVAGTQAHVVNGSLTIIPATSGADLNALFMNAGTATGTVRNYWKNSTGTRSFEMDADFSSGTENLLFQSDSAGIGGFSRAGAWTIGGNGLTNIHRLNIDTQSTVGAAGGASALPATPTGYLKFKVNGTTTFVVPYYAAS